MTSQIQNSSRSFAATKYFRVVKIPSRLAEVPSGHWPPSKAFAGCNDARAAVQSTVQEQSKNRSKNALAAGSRHRGSAQSTKGRPLTRVVAPRAVADHRRGAGRRGDARRAAADAALRRARAVHGLVGGVPEAAGRFDGDAGHEARAAPERSRRLAALRRGALEHGARVRRRGGPVRRAGRVPGALRGARGRVPHEAPLGRPAVWKSTSRRWRGG